MSAITLGWHVKNPIDKTVYHYSITVLFLCGLTNTGMFLLFCFSVAWICTFGIQMLQEKWLRS